MKDATELYYNSREIILLAWQKSNILFREDVPSATLRMQPGITAASVMFRKRPILIVLAWSSIDSITQKTFQLRNWSYQYIHNALIDGMLFLTQTELTAMQERIPTDLLLEPVVEQSVAHVAVLAQENSN